MTTGRKKHRASVAANLCRGAILVLSVDRFNPVKAKDADVLSGGADLFNPVKAKDADDAAPLSPPSEPLPGQGVSALGQVGMQNYTELGFKKMRAPEEVWRLAKRFWEANQDRYTWERESSTTYVDHWSSPTWMVSLHNNHLQGAGNNIEGKIWNATKKPIQEWISGVGDGSARDEASEYSLDGIRVYTEGAVLATRVDRLPRICSAVLNVAQDVASEPWPIEVYGHDGNAYNITLEPGDMVLYESHSVLYGRPFPLKGRFHANLFIHFEPSGHSLQHKAQDSGAEAARGARDTNVAGRHGGEAADDLPPHVVPGSAAEEQQSRKTADDYITINRGTPAHLAANRGDVRRLEAALNEAKDSLNAKDANGWTPLHEGARGGQEDVVRLLLDRGALINEKERTGKTPLDLSIKANGKDHSVTRLLEKKAEDNKASSATKGTPAHIAAHRGDVQWLEAAIHTEKDWINAKDANGWTPLHEGARGGHEDVVRLLLDLGASIDEKERTGKTPLDLSIEANGQDHSATQLLEKKKAEDNKVFSVTGGTPAHLAANRGDVRRLEATINKVKDWINAKDVNGWTPLHEGARGGHEDVVRLLLDRGAPINAKERTGKTPLDLSIKANGRDHPVSQLLTSVIRGTPAHLAAHRGDARRVEEAINKEKGHLHAKDTNGWTPLHEAARGGHEDVVRLLVDRGARIDAKERTGKTPLDWSIKANGKDHPVSQLLASLDGSEL